ncbi:MAG: AMP-binding protein, partial [bacterium]
YTSGTTGQPKGVVLSHDNLIITSRNSVERDRLTADEETLSYLPMAWVGDNIFSYGQAYVAGFCINCPESEHTVALDLREIGPTYYFAPPRIFENILTNVMIRMEDAGRIKRAMFDYFLAVARKVGVRILNREPVGWLDRIKYALGDALLYAPLKNIMGFSRIRVAYTAGEAIGPEIFDFFRSLGINVKQLYGQTEGAVFVTMQPDGEVYADSVGVPAPQVEIRIADDGEVVYRGPGAFIGYHKNEQATRETKDAQGWVHTGDAGYFDRRGHLHIIDRAKDVGKLNDGTLFAPKFLENKLKFFPQIKEAVTFGDGRDYVAAFINIDLDAVGNWAERNNIAYASYQELAAHPRTYEMMARNIDAVNRDLAADEQLRGAQIRRFLILHKELDPDDGEITRTRKVRRSTILDKYAALVDALYSTRTHCHIDTQVTFEDGRTGSIEADLEIRDAPECAPLAKSA